MRRRNLLESSLHRQLQREYNVSVTKVHFEGFRKTATSNSRFLIQRTYTAFRSAHPRHSPSSRMNLSDCLGLYDNRSAFHTHCSTATCARQFAAH